MGILKKIGRAIDVFLPSRKSLGGCGENSFIEFPSYISWPKSVYLEDDTRIRQGAKITISEHSKLIIKKYTVISMNCMIIPNKHVSTVGIPQILLGVSSINDQHYDIIIGEDVWVGANVTIIGNVKLGRGCLCGACSTVTKEVPPYAIVVGSPAKIVGVKFTIDQIIEHEKVLYPENERFTREYIEELFETYYQGKKVFGVSTEFTGDNIERLKVCIKARHFQQADYLERIKPLCKK